MGLIDVALLLCLVVAVFILGIVLGLALGIVVIWIGARMVGTDADLFDALAYSARMLVVGPLMTTGADEIGEEQEPHEEDDDGITD